MQGWDIIFRFALMKHTFYSILTLAALSIFLPGKISAQLTDTVPDEVYADSVAGIRAKSIGVYIEEIASGKVVMDVHGEVPMIPASITKVLTSATYFSSGDINSRFSTSVYLTGSTTDSILNGNIVIVCDGDPTLESRHFPKQNGFPTEIADSLRSRGITRVTGSIIIEAPDWIGTKQPKGWSTEDFTWTYGCGYLPVNFADNTMTVTLSATNAPVCTPASPESVFRRKQGKGSTISRHRDAATYTFTHAPKKPASIKVANGAPGSSLKYAITSAFADCGISIDDKSASETSSSRRLLLTHFSPPKSEILKSLLLRSDNMMAEAMLRQASVGKSRTDALAFQRSLWTKRGLDFTDIVIEDGSGLSRTNRITPYFMADLLAWMLDQHPDFMKFCNYLPLAGQTGTLRNFLKGTALDGRLRAKTGSLSDVQCYAGYATDKLGVPTHIVVIMVNGFKGNRSNLKNQLERMLLEKIP